MVAKRTIKSHYTWKPVPTLLNHEMCEKALWYVYEGYAELGDAVPSRAGLAAHLEVSVATLANWKKKNETFKEILDLLNTHQERALINGGLRGEHTTNIAKMLLMKHGYTDQAALAIGGSVSGDGELVQDGRIRVEFVEAGHLLPQVEREVVPVAVDGVGQEVPVQ